MLYLLAQGNFIYVFIYLLIYVFIYLFIYLKSFTMCTLLYIKWSLHLNDVLIVYLVCYRNIQTIYYPYNLLPLLNFLKRIICTNKLLNILKFQFLIKVIICSQIRQLFQITHYFNAIIRYSYLNIHYFQQN